MTGLAAGAPTAILVQPVPLPSVQPGTWPQAAKIPIVATSTEVADWMLHCEPSGA